MAATPAGPADSPASRLWALLLFLCAIGFATYGSLVPFNFDTGRSASLWEWIRSVPDRLTFASGRIDFFSNVCLYVPVGFGGMAWLAWTGRPLRAMVSLIVVMAFAVALSVVNEGAQTMLPTRVASYSDVAAQLIGAILGCVSWIMFGRSVRTWLSRLEYAQRGHQRLELLLQGYFVFQFCMSVFPLDVSIHPVDLYHKLQRGQINLIPFVGHDWDADLVAEMLFFSFTSIPYGALATRLWMTSPTGLRNVADSLALGTAMVMGIELCQLFVQSRFTDATQVVMGAAGVLVGVLLMHGLWPQGVDGNAASRSWIQRPGTWFLAAMLYVFVPAAFLLWPYDFVFDGAVVQQKLHAMVGIPFDHLFQSSPLPISTIIIRDVLLYWPLGMLLGAGIRWMKSTWRRPCVVLGTLSIVAIAAGIEILQTVVPQRHADLTDVLLSSVAGILGLGCVVLHSGGLQPISAGGEISTGKT